MSRQLVRYAIAILLCSSVTLVEAAQRGKGGAAGGRSGGAKPEGREAGGAGGNAAARGGAEGAGQRGSAPGGAWSSRTHQGGQGADSLEGRGDAGAAAFGRRGSQASGAEGAAAGAAFSDRNSPNASGKEGAAAGAAAVNRNQPQYTGKEGIAAGAAVSSRNSPQVSGAEGAAAGAAAVNRNQPQYSGAQGAAAGAAVANRNEPGLTGAQGAVAGSAAVRGAYNNTTIYTNQWYASNSELWVPQGWTSANAWAPTTWGAVAAYTGAAAAPVSYNYGSNVIYQDGNVTIDGGAPVSADAFSQQAATLAQAGAAAATPVDGEWLSLGIFAMVRNESQHPQLILQLAINKQGLLRGNFTDEVTEHSQSVQGAVDPKTQRAAWTVGDNTTTVMEAGLSNLAQGEAPALIHKNGQTDHWLLIRLDARKP